MAVADEWEAALFVLEHEKDGQVRTGAARRLREILGSPGGDQVNRLGIWQTLIPDRQDTVRRVGAQLAAELLEPEEAEQVLTGLVKDSSPLVRVQAAGGLADLERRSSLHVFEKLLADDALPVRFEAARGLAALGDGSGLPVLVQALEDDSFRFRALGSLAALGDGRSLPAIRKLFHRALLPGFERTQAAGALAKMGDPEGEQYLLARIQGRWKMDRAFAIELCGDLKLPEAYERLLGILSDAKDTCRGAAARGLGRLGDPRATAPLWSLLEDSAQPDELRLDAAEGLCLLGAPEPISRLEQALRTLKSAEALSQAGELLQEYA